jgi:putative chitinase
MALDAHQIAALKAEGVPRDVIDRAIARLAAGGWRRTMQARLGVAADGIFGLITYRALFLHMAAADEKARSRVPALAEGAVRHFGAFGIDATPQRLTEFMGECAHETGGWQWMAEIASGAAYEGRRDLGNTQPGDGRRFKGRGLIQLTGRANYTRAAQETGLPLLQKPELLEQPDNAVLAACLYWRWRGLNELADAGQSDTITRRINGGINGIEDRRARKARMRRLWQ